MTCLRGPWPPDKSNAALSHASEPFVQLVMVSVHDVIGPLRVQRRQPNIDSGTGKSHAPRQRSRAAWNSEHLFDIGQHVNGSFAFRGRVLPPLEWVLLRSWLRQVPCYVLFHQRSHTDCLRHFSRRRFTAIPVAVSNGRQ
jgi:hypothetical protein